MYLPNNRGSLYRLEEVSLKEPFYKIRDDYDKILIALGWMKLMSRSLHGEGEVAGLFKLLRDSLEALQEFDPFSVDLIFRRQTLAQMGYQLNLERCVRCEADSNPVGRFSFQEGGMLCTACTPGTGEGGYRFYSRAHWVLKKGKNPWESGDVKKATEILELAFHDYLGA